MGPLARFSFSVRETGPPRIVRAAGAFADRGNGGCAAAAMSSPSDSRNVRIARLGVSCPAKFDNDSRRHRRREYVFDDSFFECNGNAGNRYNNTCFNGETCIGTDCEADFSRLSISANVLTFLDTCVELSEPSDVPTIRGKKRACC